MEKFVFILQNNTQVTIPITILIPIPIPTWYIFLGITKLTIRIGKISLPTPRRHKKNKTTIPVGQICLPILRRHKNTKTTIPIGQICLPIPTRHKKIQKSIPFPLWQIVFYFFLQWYGHSTKLYLNQTTRLK